MASIRKRQPNRDRISNLPDNLITHILSFLSTKDAVKTSALSTSWILQWTLVPLLLFVDKPRCSQCFIDFVYRVLLYKATPLDLFQLKHYTPMGLGVWTVYDAIYVSDWISVALSRHVRQLDVTSDMRSRCYLPDSLFSSKTLIVLKLKGDFVFRVPEKVCLESLKIFHFDVREFDGDESFTRFVSSCPALEELEIIGGLGESVKVFNISSLVLKKLILTDLCSLPFEKFGTPHAYELVLNTPSLQYLEHNDMYGVPNGCNLNTLHCLDTARLQLKLCDDNLKRHNLDPLISARPLAELVEAIYNVRVLYILGSSFEALYRTALPNFELPQFNRLICLELGRIEFDAGLRLLMAFLKSSPHLESLSYLYHSDETWYPPTDVPFCMLYNLKVIDVTYFYSVEPFLSMVTYFLKKTNFLEKLIIRQAKKSEEHIQKIFELPRASNSCKIILT